MYLDIVRVYTVCSALDETYKKFLVARFVEQIRFQIIEYI